ncbi:MAG: class I SAM-dependent methyltransferase [Solirubrobacteraceae bacterium]
MRGVRSWLFDTFSGIPFSNLTKGEESKSLGGKLTDTSAEYVDGLLSRWSGRYRICEGDLFDTLPSTETGSLAFVHVDLNASAPTRLALEYAHPRMVPGGVMLFDDYGRGYEDQRTAIEEFFAERPETVIALPTGQGVVIANAGLTGGGPG